jgi:jasmonate ZIM domain-containing protein
MRWQFPAKSGATPAYMSFRTPREEGSKEEFSISGFRPPAAVVGDGIKKHASSPVASQQVCLSSDLHV